jgi:hypothetical protein
MLDSWWLGENNYMHVYCVVMYLVKKENTKKYASSGDSK